MSEDKQRRDLERFLRQQLTRVRETPLDRLVLRHAAQGSKGSEVETITIPEGLDGDSFPAFCDEVLALAQADADGFGEKLQRYVVIALEAGKKDGPRFPFRLRGEGDEDSEEGEEAPTEKGLVSQLMRHNEALARMLVMTTGSQIQSLTRQAEAKDKVIERMFEQRQKDQEAVEASKSLQAERDNQLLLASGAEDRKAELLKKLDLLMPLVVNKLAGNNILPTGAGADVFGKLSESLSPDQLQKIAQFLTAEQQMLLLTLLKAAREPKKAPEQAS